MLCAYLLNHFSRGTKHMKIEAKIVIDSMFVPFLKFGLSFFTKDEPF